MQHPVKSAATRQASRLEGACTAWKALDRPPKMLES